jgi:hypothetical protein
VTDVWLGIAIFCIILYAFISITQKVKGDRHIQKARELAAAGDWEQACLSYKQAIINRLDSSEALGELVAELSRLYRSRGHLVDLNQILEVPDAIRNLSAGVGNQKKTNELMIKLNAEARKFLNSLPGPPIPGK